jgi:hypothetical protein
VAIARSDGANHSSFFYAAGDRGIRPATDDWSLITSAPPGPHPFGARIAGSADVPPEPTPGDRIDPPLS